MEENLSKSISKQCQTQKKDLSTMIVPVLRNQRLGLPNISSLSESVPFLRVRLCSICHCCSLAAVTGRVGEMAQEGQWVEGR